MKNLSSRRKTVQRRVLSVLAAVATGVAMLLPSVPAQAAGSVNGRSVKLCAAGLYTPYLVFPNRGITTPLVFPSTYQTTSLSGTSQELVYVYGKRNGTTVFLGYSYITLSSVFQAYGEIPGYAYYSVWNI